MTVQVLDTANGVTILRESGTVTPVAVMIDGVLFVRAVPDADNAELLKKFGE